MNENEPANFCGVWQNYFLFDETLTTINTALCGSRISVGKKKLHQLPGLKLS